MACTTVQEGKTDLASRELLPQIAATTGFDIDPVSFPNYAAAWNGLIPEITRTEATIVRLSRLLAIFGGPRIVAVICCVFSFFACLAPMIAIDDSRFPIVRSTMKMSEAQGTTLRNRPFMF